MRRRTPTFSRASRFTRATAALAVLCVAEHAAAGNILQRAGRPGAPSGAAAAAPDGASTAPLDAAAAAARAQAAAARARGPLARALQEIKRAQAAQEAARAAALLDPGAVPDGLAPGGLQVAAGADQDPALWQGAARPVSSTGQNGRAGVTVVQNDSHAILTWETFNVGARTDLVYDQSAGGDAASTWVASCPRAAATTPTC